MAGCAMRAAGHTGCKMGDDRTASPLDAIQPCLDYLDKEMTIQGVLSGFSMAAAAAVFAAVMAAKDASAFVLSLQSKGAPYLEAGCAALVVAGALFYKERSDLAWLYSGFGLANADDSLCAERPKDSWTVLECLDMFDSWHLWLWYRMGTACLGAAAVEFVLALVSTWTRTLAARTTAAWGELDKILACAVLASLIVIYLRLRARLKRRDAESVPRKKKEAVSRKRSKANADTAQEGTAAPEGAR